MFGKKIKKQKRSPIAEGFREPTPMHGDINIYSIAIVLDNEVQDVIRAEARLAAMLLSDPILVDITDLENKPGIGIKYNPENGKFGKGHEENNI